MTSVPSLEMTPATILGNGFSPFNLRQVLAVPIEPGEAPNAPAARHTGAVAFSRTGNLETGEFANAIVLATFGVFDAGMHGG